MDEFEDIGETLNQPIISEKEIIYNKHKIFVKYTSNIYQKYNIDLLETLCKKSFFKNKVQIFHRSIHFLLKILYISENEIYLTNYDLLILVCFYLGVITVENQINIPNITKLKLIYSEKYGVYSNEEINRIEIICIKLLQYDINISTAYDYLCYIFNNDSESIESSKNILEKFIKENPSDYVLKKPGMLIKECLPKLKVTKSIKFKSIMKSKFNTYQKKLNNNKINYNEESISTSISSSSQNVNNMMTTQKTYMSRNIQRKNLIKNYHNDYCTQFLRLSEKNNEEKNTSYFKYKNARTMFGENKNKVNEMIQSYKNIYSSPNDLFCKPYIKKKESNCYFTSNKKYNKNFKLPSGNNEEKGKKEKRFRMIDDDVKKQLFFDKVSSNLVH